MEERVIVVVVVVAVAVVVSVFVLIVWPVAGYGYERVVVYLRHVDGRGVS